MPPIAYLTRKGRFDQYLLLRVFNMRFRKNRRWATIICRQNTMFPTDRRKWYFFLRPQKRSVDQLHDAIDASHEKRVPLRSNLIDDSDCFVLYDFFLFYSLLQRPPEH